MRSIFSVYPGLNRFFNVILEREGAGEIDSGIIEALRNAVRMNT
jgi:hypothetical protein